MEDLLSNPRNFLLLEVGAVIITLLLLRLVDKIWAKIFVMVITLLGIPLAMSMGFTIVMYPDVFIQNLWMPVSIFIIILSLFVLTARYDKKSD